MLKKKLQPKKNLAFKIYINNCQETGYITTFIRKAAFLKGCLRCKTIVCHKIALDV